LDRISGIRNMFANPKHHCFVGDAGTFPAFVAIHGVVAPGYGGDDADTDSGNAGLEGCQKPGTTAG
jgi:hypothetical protein